MRSSSDLGGSGFRSSWRRTPGQSALQSRAPRRRQTRVWLLALAAGAAAPSVLHADIDFWTGATDNLWSTPGNWSAGAYPDNGNGGVADWNVILGGLPATNLDISVTVDTLTVLSTGSLNILDGQSLTIAGGSLANDSLITVNSNAGSDNTSLIFSANAFLSGGGTINLATSSAQINTGVGAMLTQVAGHTIAGAGQINAALVNNGTVNANVSNGHLVLGTNNMTNASLLEATGGGQLDINGITIANAGGTISAAQGASVNLLNGAAIGGGTFSSDATSAIRGMGAVTLSGVTLTSGSNYLLLDNGTVPAANTTHLTGGLLENNGTVTVNSNGGADPVILNADSFLVVSGTGSIVLNSTGNVSATAQFNSTGQALVTQQTGHTISGSGRINASLSNFGIVNANVPGSDLVLATNSKINHNLFEATNGGILDIDGSGNASPLSIAQLGIGQILANGATVRILNNVSVNGGVLNTQDFLPPGGTPVTGIIQSGKSGAVTSNTFTSVTNNGRLDVLGGNTLFLSGATFIDNGAVTVNADNGTRAAQLGLNNSLTLDGTGTVVLSGQGTSTGSLAQIYSVVSLSTPVLTQTATHTIAGSGQINSPFTNNGMVNANVSGADLFLQTNNMTNAGTMQATNGGRLDVNGIILTNNAGTLGASGGGSVNLIGATLLGGAFTTDSTAAINATGTNILNAVTISNGGTFAVTGGGLVLLNGGTTITGGTLSADAASLFRATGPVSLVNVSLKAGTNFQVSDNGSDPTGNTTHVAGLLANSGTITINSNGGSDAVIVNADGSTILSGSGTIALSSAGNLATSAQFNASGQAVVTQQNGNSIVGSGQINAPLLNFGVVNANVSGSDLFIQNTATDNNLFEATNGGVLDINGSAIVPGPMAIAMGKNGQILANGGTVRLLGNVKITGGTLATQNFTPPGGATVLGIIQNAAGSNTLSGVVNNGRLDVLSGSQLHLTGGFTNNGTLNINADGGASTNTAVLLDASLSLAGRGPVNLEAANDVPATAQIVGDNSLSAVTLTVPSTATVTGAGQIGVGVTMTGTINANLPGSDLLFLKNVANTGTLEATNGGRLDISGITLTNFTETATGKLIANGGSVRLGNSATVSGGNLSSSAGGQFVTDLGNGTVTFSNNPVFAAGSTLNIVDNSTVHLTAAVVDNGTINVNSNGGTHVAAITADSNATLFGTGTAVLNATGNDPSRAQLNSAPNATLFLGQSHSITGTGQINANFVNNGTVNANVSGAHIVLQSNNKTNTATMEATGGGVLDINAITLTNTGATLAATGGGTVNLLGATVTGGTLSADASSFINVAGNNSLTGGAKISGAGALAVNDQALLALAHNATPRLNTVSSLAINGSGTLDMGNNALQINYGANASPDSTIRGWITSGYNNGSWTGPGITSSDAASSAGGLAVGYANGADGTVTNLQAGQELVRVTIPGDTNLDGTVNFADLVNLAQHYGQSGASWDQGDFNYDGSVGFDDLTALAQHYGDVLSPVQLAALPGAFAADVRAAFAAVPEPAALSILMLAPVFLGRRRR